MHILFQWQLARVCTAASVKREAALDRARPCPVGRRCAWRRYICCLFGQAHYLLLNSGEDKHRLRMHPADSESTPCTRPTVYAWICSSAAINRLRFLITFGDVPLVAVTCTNEALYVIRKRDYSGIGPPLLEPRGPSAHAQWNLREGRADSSQRHSVMALRSTTVKRGMVLQKG